MERQIRLFAIVADDEIVVTSDASFRAAYAEGLIIRSSIVRRRTDMDDHEVIAQAWQAPNDKARETRVDWNTHHPLSRKKTENMT